MEVKIDEAEVVLDKEVKDGRVIGLTQWEGRKVKIVIMKEGMK
jgi:hypothetical protein